MACQETYISGTVTPSSLATGTVLTLTGLPTGSIMSAVNISGNYSFIGVANGTYTVTPSQAGKTFIPASQTVIISGVSVGNINFFAQAQ